MPSKPSPLDLANQTIRNLKNELHKERTSPERQAERQALLEEKHRLQQERDAAVRRAESATRERAAYAMAFSAMVSLWHVIGSGKEQ
jgi:Na+-translocating ferredoxin:NAD+ oxidoreductase RnfC subunit